MNEQLNSVAAALRRSGFESEVFATAQEAVDYVRRDLPANADITFGGSMTTKQLNLENILREDGHTVLWHWEVGPAERPALLHKAMHSPNYICSVNALTEDQAVQIALDHSGFTADQISRLRVEHEIDDRIPQYDIEFHQGDWEYEFEIHGQTGQILSFDKDHKND